MTAKFQFGLARRPHALLDKLDRILEQRYESQNLDLAQLANEMGMSARHLQRRLKNLMGCTPSTYVRSYRLYQSLNYLRSGESVAKTAKAVGFSSQSYFASCFKAEFGFAPTEFRKGRHNVAS